MFDSNNVAIIGALALAVAAFTIGSSESGSDVIENYGNLPSFTTRAVPSYSANHAAMQKGQVFAAPPSMQAMLSPRFNSGSIPASITFQPPSTSNMAYNPRQPMLGVATPGPGQTGSRQGQKAFPLNRCTGTNYSGNTVEGFQQPNSMIIGNTPSIIASAGQNPTAAVGMEDGGSAPQPVVFDRLITACRSSRLYALGDPIRGDLAIPPCNSGWFQVSVTPSIDLQQGALAVMGGTFNEQGQNLASLVNMSSGGTTTAISGVDMSTSINTCLAGAGNDVTSIAF
jgi:hypothetical protein